MADTIVAGSQEPTCPSCGVPYLEHRGVVGLCAQVRGLKESRDFWKIVAKEMHTRATIARYWDMDMGEIIAERDALRLALADATGGDPGETDGENVHTALLQALAVLDHQDERIDRQLKVVKELEAEVAAKSALILRAWKALRIDCCVRSNRRELRLGHNECRSAEADPSGKCALEACPYLKEAI